MVAFHNVDTNAVSDHLEGEHQDVEIPAVRLVAPWHDGSTSTQKFELPSTPRPL